MFEPFNVGPFFLSIDVTGVLRHFVYPGVTQSSLTLSLAGRALSSTSGLCESGRHREITLARVSTKLLAILSGITRKRRKTQK